MAQQRMGNNAAPSSGNEKMNASSGDVAAKVGKEGRAVKAGGNEARQAGDGEAVKADGGELGRIGGSEAAKAGSGEATQASGNNREANNDGQVAKQDTSYVLAFDTANEVIAIGVGRLYPASLTVELVASEEVAAHRASNTQLLPHIDALLARLEIARSQLACVCVGRGPGSFTGVRIAMATAKGIAQALGVALVGVSSLDVVAWHAWNEGVRGQLAVVADAMRKEVYPVRYTLDEASAQRLDADSVVKAGAAAERFAHEAGTEGNFAQGDAEHLAAQEHTQDPFAQDYTQDPLARGHTQCLVAQDGIEPLTVQGGTELSTAQGTGGYQFAGDGLYKYAESFEPYGKLLSENLWAPTGRGLLLALQAAWQAGAANPFDAARHNPAFLLPVYTRLSDAEENERVRLSKNDPKNLRTGVQDVALRRDQRTTMHDTAILNAQPDEQGITYKPLDAAHAQAVADLEAEIMGSDAWNAALVADELPRPDRTWWAAYAPSADAAEVLVGYAGGWVVDGQVQILKVGTRPGFRHQGIAQKLLSLVAHDARDLGATTVSLEVRVSNVAAQGLYKALGMKPLGMRPHYYSDREDAAIYEGPLGGLVEKMAPCPESTGGTPDVAGIHLQVDAARNSQVSATAERVAAAGSAAAAERAVAASPSAAAECAAAGESAATDESATADESPSAAGTAAADESPSASSPTAAVEPPSTATSAAAAAPAATSKLVRPLILAIESSCDETAAAIVDGNGTLLSDVVASQIDFHARFGGVVPEIASRKHVEAICGVCNECFDVAASRLGRPALTWGDLDGVAVTYAPGLVGALVVGVAFAKGAAWAADKPLVGVNHLEGHLYANKIGAPRFAPPAVVSLVSGGNTMLVHMRDWGNYHILGQTIDDAVGEAFDKVAKALGLGYPGGPAISKQAALGNPAAIPFPRAMMHSGDMRFSLSGLKTAVVTYINNERAAGRPLNMPDICASFQQAVVDVQVKKAQRALRETGAPTFCLGGGVAANPVLRSAYENMCSKQGVRLVMPPLSACGDNAGMIALVALDRFRENKFLGLDADAFAHANLEEPY